MSDATRTVVQALEDAAQSPRTGFRFIEESEKAEPFFTYGGIERATSRFGGALQALGLVEPLPAVAHGALGFPPGHWRNYREAFAAEFARLAPVAARLGYPAD